MVVEAVNWKYFFDIVEEKPNDKQARCQAIMSAHFGMRRGEAWNFLCV